jgi:hypothetical protein
MSGSAILPGEGTCGVMPLISRARASSAGGPRAPSGTVHGQACHLTAGQTLWNSRTGPARRIAVTGGRRSRGCYCDTDVRPPEARVDPDVGPVDRAGVRFCRRGPSRRPGARPAGRRKAGRSRVGEFGGRDVGGPGGGDPACPGPGSKGSRECLQPEEVSILALMAATSGAPYENNPMDGMRPSRRESRMTALAAGLLAPPLTGAGDAPLPDRSDGPPRPGRSPGDCVDPPWAVDAASPEVWSDP